MFGSPNGGQDHQKAISKKHQKYDAQHEPKLVPKGVPKWLQNQFWARGPRDFHRNPEGPAKNPEGPVKNPEGPAPKSPDPTMLAPFYYPRGPFSSIVQSILDDFSNMLQTQNEPEVFYGSEAKAKPTPTQRHIASPDTFERAWILNSCGPQNECRAEMQPTFAQIILKHVTCMSGV